MFFVEKWIIVFKIDNVGQEWNDGTDHEAA